MKNFSIIVAIDEERGIGKAGFMPWNLPGDMKHFKAITIQADDKKKNAVIMGRKTWESIPERFRPLEGRINAVLSRNEQSSLPKECLRFSSLTEALKILGDRRDIDRIFVIGGANLFDQAIILPECKKIYVTGISGRFSCDVFFPEIPPDFKKTSQSPSYTENNFSFSFTEYERN
ncbi:MAG: dihydrofolate reductase [Candidatus Omnitrophota bacterium]